STCVLPPPTALGSTMRSSNTELETGRTRTPLSPSRSRMYLTWWSDSWALSCSRKPKASHNQRAAAPGFRYRKTGVIVVTYCHVVGRVGSALVRNAPNGQGASKAAHVLVS